MFDNFICGLEPIIGCEVVKENPQAVKEACVLAEQISYFDNLVGGGRTHGKFRQ